MGTGPSPNPRGLFCASLVSGVLSNVYSTSALAEGPIPENPSLTTINVATITSPTVWVDEIQVRWQATDTEILQLLSSKTAISSSTSISKTPATPGALSSTPHLPTSAQSSTNGASAISTPTSEPTAGLSAGAKIAIGVAVPLLVLALVLGSYILFRRSKRKSQHRSTLVESKYAGYPRELDARYNERPLKGELEANGQNLGSHMLQNQQQIASQMRRSTPYELPGYGVGELPG
jgi:hypothetical protein